MEQDSSIEATGKCMDQGDKPSKERIRAWLLSRQATRAPLPDREQIGRELGWTRAKDRKTTTDKAS